MFENLRCTSIRELSKRECFSVQKTWRTNFATNVKKLTGKWQVDEFLWSGFASGLQPCKKDGKGIDIYRRIKPEPIYMFCEDACVECVPQVLPEFFRDGHDVYVMASSGRWTAVFRHDDVFYFAYAEGLET